MARMPQLAQIPKVGMKNLLHGLTILVSISVMLPNVKSSGTAAERDVEMKVCPTTS